MFYINILKKSLAWLIKQRKNIICASFVINCFEIFRVIFQYTFSITKENIVASVGSKGEPIGNSVSKIKIRQAKKKSF